MPDENEGGTTLIPLFDRLAAGDLKLLAHKRVKSFPAVRGLHETMDVVQGAAMRLHRALKSVHPTSVEQFMRLASTQIRRELIDLKRREFGVNEDRVEVVFGPGGSTSEAKKILDGPPRNAEEKDRKRAQRQEIDEVVEHLPEEEREVFDQVFYQGLSYGDAAHALRISESTVKRRWYDAQETLHRLLHPES